jgi:hypothetical protein
MKKKKLWGIFPKCPQSSANPTFYLIIDQLHPSSALPMCRMFIVEKKSARELVPGGEKAG